MLEPSSIVHAERQKSVGHGHVISLAFQHQICTDLHSSAFSTLPKLSPVKQICGLEPSKNRL